MHMLHLYDVPSLRKPTRCHADDLEKAIPEPCVHPAVNKRIIHAVRHRKPMRCRPHDVHARQVIECEVNVPSNGNSMEWQPANGVYDHDDNQHLDNLK